MKIGERATFTATFVATPETCRAAATLHRAAQTACERDGDTAGASRHDSLAQDYEDALQDKS